MMCFEKGRGRVHPSFLKRTAAAMTAAARGRTSGQLGPKLWKWRISPAMVYLPEVAERCKKGCRRVDHSSITPIPSPFHARNYGIFSFYNILILYAKNNLKRDLFLNAEQIPLYTFHITSALSSIRFISFTNWAATIFFSSKSSGVNCIRCKWILGFD